MLDSGLFDIVALRMAQISRDEPLTMGFDLVGLNPDYKTARASHQGLVRDARQAPAVALPDQVPRRLAGRPAGAVLQEADHQAGRRQGPEGPRLRPEPREVLPAPGRDADPAGLRRSAPKPVARRRRLRDHQRAVGQLGQLARGVDAHAAAGFPVRDERLRDQPGDVEEVQPRRSRRRCRPRSRSTNDIWKYSEELSGEAVACNLGKEPCSLKKFKLVEVPVTPADVATVRDAMRDVSLPTWSEACEKTAKGCTEEWKKTVGAAVGVK